MTRGEREALLELRAANRWPEGTRRLTCLTCGKRFDSTGRDNRVCESCRASTDRAGDLWSGRRR